MAEKNILNKIRDLKTRLYGTDRDDHLEEVEGWEEQAKKAMLLDNLLEHQGIKIIVDNLKSDIEALNARLAREKSSDLPDSSRDAIIDVRDYMEYFLQMFIAAKSDLREVEKEVDNQLEEEDEE